MDEDYETIAAEFRQAKEDGLRDSDPDAFAAIKARLGEARREIREQREAEAAELADGDAAVTPDSIEASAN